MLRGLLCADRIVRFSVKMHRKSFFYFSAVLLPNFLLATLGFFLLPGSEPERCITSEHNGHKSDTADTDELTRGDRVSIIVTLLLACIAYQTMEGVPRSSTMTYLHGYLLACMVCLILVTLFAFGIGVSAKDWIWRIWILSNAVLIFCYSMGWFEKRATPPETPARDTFSTAETVAIELPKRVASSPTRRAASSRQLRSRTPSGG